MQNTTQPIKILSWNINFQHKPWQKLSGGDADIALLQEARLPEQLPENIEVIAGGAPNEQHPYDRWPMIVQLSSKVKMEGLKLVNLWQYPHTAKGYLPKDSLATSDPTTMAIAKVIKDNQEFYVVSVYGRWIKPHPSANSNWRVGYQDASIHRVISDLSVLIGSTKPSTHRLLVAGDFNTIYGATQQNQLALPERDQTIVDRFKALGLVFMGPQYPAGRPAKPTPQGLPATTKNVPTYYSSHQKIPEKAQNQLDYVFASKGFHQHLKVEALNSVENWGPSDHCRLLIEVKL